MDAQGYLCILGSHKMKGTYRVISLEDISVSSKYQYFPPNELYFLLIFSYLQKSKNLKHGTCRLFSAKTYLGSLTSLCHSMCALLKVVIRVLQSFHSHTWLPGYKHIRTCLLAGFITEYPQHYYHNPSGYALGIMVIVLRVFMINPYRHVLTINIYKSFHEMKGNRDGKSVQQDTAYSAVVVNDHMYPRPCLYHFFMFL